MSENTKLHVVKPALFEFVNKKKLKYNFTGKTEDSTVIYFKKFYKRIATLDH